MEKMIRKILSGTQNYSSKDESKEMSKEEMELYLFLRGGFTAK